MFCFKGENSMSCILTRRKKGLVNIDFCQVFHHYIQINENWLSYGAGHTVRITLSLCLFIGFIYVNLIAALIEARFQELSKRSATMVPDCSARRLYLKIVDQNILSATLSKVPLKYSYN